MSYLEDTEDIKNLKDLFSRILIIFLEVHLKKFLEFKISNWEYELKNFNSYSLKNEFSNSSEVSSILLQLVTQ